MKAVCRALGALTVISGCLAGLAYAATEHGAGGSVPGGHGRAAAGPPGLVASASASRQGPRRPPRPLITKHPAKASLATSAGFAFTDKQRDVRFQCRLDKAGWSACQGSVVFKRLALGAHSFAVRALDRFGGRSPASRFDWARVEPMRFSIAPQLSGLSALYPGAPPVVLPVVLANPNRAPIFVTSLRVTATGGPPGCDSAANLALFRSSASSSAPIRIPARGSVSLPAAGASPPSMQLRELPLNQDACQGAQFSLAFSGGAHG